MVNSASRTIGGNRGESREGLIHHGRWRQNQHLMSIYRIVECVYEARTYVVGLREHLACPATNAVATRRPVAARKVGNDAPLASFFNGSRLDMEQSRIHANTTPSRFTAITSDFLTCKVTAHHEFSVSPSY